MFELSWIYSSWKSCPVHVYQSSLWNLTCTLLFISIRHWASFCSQKISVLLNLSFWSILLSPAIILPVQYCSLPFCDLQHHDFSITLNFSVIICFQEIGLASFQATSLLIFILSLPFWTCITNSVYFLANVTVYCYLIYVMPRNIFSLM